MSAQSITPLETTNPPRLHCSRKGNSNIIASWPKRKALYFLVLKNQTSDTIDTTWYANGMAADTQNPSTAYTVTQNTASTTIRVAAKVSMLLHSRSSSVSEGRVPVFASLSNHSVTSSFISAP